MKEIFETPAIEIIELKHVDIFSTSCICDSIDDSNLIKHEDTIN